MRFHRTVLLNQIINGVNMITSIKRGGETSSMKPQQPVKGAKA